MLQEINEETNKSKFAYDNIRRKYLKELFEYTNRNVIIYYSGFLEKPEFSLVSSISDRDVTGFMQSVYQLDKSKGIDLIIHTPGDNNRG